MSTFLGEDWHRQRLEAFERIRPAEFGVRVAADYCAKMALVMPEWVANGLRQLLIDQLNPTRNNEERGRASGVAARARQNRIHAVRWDRVEEARRAQRYFASETKNLRRLRTLPPGRLEYYEKMSNWLGNTLMDACECASVTLRGTAARGEAQAIKSSWMLCRNTTCNSFDTSYFSVDDKTLRDFGVDVESPDEDSSDGDSPLDKKLTLLFDLKK